MHSLPITKEHARLLKHIIMYVITLSITGSMLLFFNWRFNDAKEQKSVIRNEIFTLTKKLDGLNKKTLQLSNAIDVWDKFSIQERSLAGLNINKSKEIIDNLVNIYNLSNVQTSFSKPQTMHQAYTTDSVSVIYSIMTLNFNATSDTNIYNFIIDISQKIPGYVQIKSLSIEKLHDITPELLEQMSNGAPVQLISVNMELYLRELKYN